MSISHHSIVNLSLDILALPFAIVAICVLVNGGQLSLAALMLFMFITISCIRALRGDE